MLGGDGLNPKPELGEIQLSAVQEAMNQMMGSAATSMSTVFNKKVDISPPTIDLMNISQNEGRDNIPDDDLLVKISFRLRIGELIDSNLMQLLPLNFSKKIVKSLMGESDEELAPATATAAQPTPPPVATSQPQPAPQASMQQPYAATSTATANVSATDVCSATSCTMYISNRCIKCHNSHRNNL